MFMVKKVERVVTLTKVNNFSIILRVTLDTNTFPSWSGPKSAIKALSLQSSNTSSRPSSYIAIISPPLHPSISSQSATLRNYARNHPASSGSSTPTSTTSNSNSESVVSKVTIFDLENKFIAHTGTFEDGVREIWEIWGSLWVLSEGGKVSLIIFQSPHLTEA